MPTTISMPQLGESVAEGTIGRWLKQPGERVERDEPLVEVITDKVNAEIPSTTAGVLSEILAEEGQTVKVGDAIALIGEAGESVQPTQAPVAGHAESAPSAPTARDGEGSFPGTGQQAPTRTTASGLLDVPASEGPRLYTPVVLRMAREHGIDLATVEGTGLGGRVSKKDLEQHIAGLQARGAEPATGAPPAAVPGDLVATQPKATVAAPVQPKATAFGEPVAAVSSASLSQDEEALPVSPIRRAIAEHMVRSVQTAPHAWGMLEVDMTEIVRLRQSAQPDWQRHEGFELTFLPFVLKAVADALREHPILNATWDRDHVVLKRRINLGIAVATDDALLVPVIKDADQMSLVGLARALRQVVQRARGGKLTLDDVQGGTFTVNNTGALGSILSHPIINQPQAAIITTEAIVKRLVVQENDAIAIRSIMNLCCSFDHRVLDGAQALRFMNGVKRRLEVYRPDSSLT